MSPTQRLYHVVAICWLALTLATATTQAESLEDAYDLYWSGSTVEALEAVGALLETADLSTRQRRDALILQGQCQIKMDRDFSAQESFCAALKLDPETQLDATNPSYSPRDIQVFAEAEERCGPTATDAAIGDKKSSGWWPLSLRNTLLIVGPPSLLATLCAAEVGLCKKDETQGNPLPLPPDPPAAARGGS